jgi:hypothetical protein
MAYEGDARSPAPSVVPLREKRLVMVLMRRSSAGVAAVEVAAARGRLDMEGSTRTTNQAAQSEDFGGEHVIAARPFEARPCDPRAAPEKEDPE